MNHGGDFPLAYMITWTTYGTWLPGDERGWNRRGSRIVEPSNPNLRRWSAQKMKGCAVVLSNDQRVLVDSVIVDHCNYRGWDLHARNVRTNHVHVVLSAALEGERVRADLKAWCNRRLSEALRLVEGAAVRKNWFTERGDVEWIDDQRHLDDATTYVNELQ